MRRNTPKKKRLPNRRTDVPQGGGLPSATFPRIASRLLCVYIQGVLRDGGLFLRLQKIESGLAQSCLRVPAQLQSHARHRPLPAQTGRAASRLKTVDFHRNPVAAEIPFAASHHRATSRGGPVPCLQSQTDRGPRAPCAMRTEIFPQESDKLVPDHLPSHACLLY